jgi:hypothetical protein
MSALSRLKPFETGSNRPNADVQIREVTGSKVTVTNLDFMYLAYCTNQAGLAKCGADMCTYCWTIKCSPTRFYRILAN